MTKSLIPYTFYSEVCQDLRQELLDFKYNKCADVVINFGSSKKFDKKVKVYFNHPLNVNIAVDKLATFTKLKGKVPIPRFTTSKLEASGYHKVYVRHSTKGSCGTGIEVVTNTNKLPDAPLYVEGIDIRNEYRFIVVRGTVLSSMIKAPKRWKLLDDIRNLQNGWRFSYNIPSNVEKWFGGTVAISAITELGLDFGAVDLIVDKNGNYYVLEVNTAFALGSKNRAKIVEAFNKMVEEVSWWDRCKTFVKGVIYRLGEVIK